MTTTAPSATKTNFLDLPIANLSFDAAIEAVFARADAAVFSYVVTPNVDHVVRLDRAAHPAVRPVAPDPTSGPVLSDPIGAAFVAAYDAAALVLCDSRILRGLGRLSGHDLQLVPGSDLTRAVLADPRIAARTIVIVGGQAALLSALQRRVPQARFIQFCPPMNVLRDEAALVEIERFVAETCADIVFFAIGAPQSEIIAHRCLRAGDSRGVGLCIGASLEFIVGDKRRAPYWMQRYGLEWLFRLASEPRRLWRRYLVEGPRIFLIWARRR